MNEYKVTIPSFYWPRWWDKEDVKNHPKYMFIFGDNDVEKGEKGQAIIRKCPNAFGIPTTKFPNNNDSSYYTDEELEENKRKIKHAIKKIMKESSNYDALIFPKDGLGTGLAELPKRAPKTYKYLNKAIQKYLLNSQS
jgi:hypothetical protein